MTHYLALAGDQAAREAWMLENLRLGGFFVLSVMHLHRMIMSMDVAESNAQVSAFAARHGIALPRGRSRMWVVAVVVGSLGLLLALVAALKWLF